VRVARSPLMTATLLAIAALAALADAPTPAGAQTVTPSVFVAYVTHQVDEGFGDERTSGPVVGARVIVNPTRTTEVSLLGYAGTLNPDSGQIDARRMSDLEVSGGVLATQWLWFDLGLRARSYTTALARQRWLSLTVGAEVREPIFDGAGQAVVRVGLLPAVSVSGLSTPNFAGTTGVGFELLRAPITGSVMFSLERYDFPTVATGPRSEQVVMLTASIGTKFPR
jgi:hypothetical protein